jgi:hypothetical protein
LTQDHGNAVAKNQTHPDEHHRQRRQQVAEGNRQHDEHGHQPDRRSGS